MHQMIVDLSFADPNIKVQPILIPSPEEYEMWMQCNWDDEEPDLYFDKIEEVALQNAK